LIVARSAPCRCPTGRTALHEQPIPGSAKEIRVCDNHGRAHAAVRLPNASRG
jgi:hypothetical protein